MRNDQSNESAARAPLRYAALAMLVLAGGVSCGGRTRVDAATPIGGSRGAESSIAASAEGPVLRPADQPEPISRTAAVRREILEDTTPARLPGALARAAGGPADRIHFDFDRADIRPADRVTLDAMVSWLRGSPRIRMVIEGHCDDRGSDEYNVALGLRRASTVRQYFIAHGLSPDRFEVASFGEERPLIAGNDEFAWSQNRRADFVITR